MTEAENLNNSEKQALNIPDVINRLFDLKRYNIDLYEGIKGNSTMEIKEANGKYVKWEEVRKLITEIRISNGL